MRSRIMSTCVAALVLWLALQSLELAAVDAGRLYEPPPAAEPELLEMYFAFPGAIDAYTDVQSASQLAVGDFVQTHRMSYEFNVGEVTENLSLELTPRDEWVAPVYYSATVIGAMRASESTTDMWIVNAALSEAFGEGLEELEPDDRVMLSDFLYAWWVVDGEELSPLGLVAEGIFPEGVTLAEYQQYLVDLYDGLSPSGTPEWAGPGAAPPPELDAYLIPRFLDYPGALDRVGGTEDLQRFSVGAFYQVYETTDDFNTGEVTETLENEIVPWIGAYAAPLLLDGEEKSMLLVLECPPCTYGWELEDHYDQDAAEALSGFGPSDRLLSHQLDGFFRVRGQGVMPLDESARGFFPSEVSLADYQELMISEICPPGEICGAVGGRRGPAIADNGDRLALAPHLMDINRYGTSAKLALALAGMVVIAIALVKWGRVP